MEENSVIGGCRSLLKMRLESLAQYDLAVEPRGLSVRARARCCLQQSISCSTCSVRSRYRSCRCLPTSCLGICLSVLRMRHALEWGNRRGLVFAWEAVWIGLIWLKLSHYLQLKVRGHVQEIPPRPVPSPPCICTSILPHHPPPFLPQHNTMHST
jgi:hypothetical protein